MIISAATVAAGRQSIAGSPLRARWGAVALALLWGCSAQVATPPSGAGSGGATTGVHDGTGGMGAGAGAGGGAGASASGGSAGQGGAGAGTAIGGAPGSGGRIGSDAGAAASGGAPGGASGGGIGGAPATSTGGAAGAGAGDRCDVGVYNPATPPATLAITGTTGDNVHDPSMILSSGTYYVFNTGLWTRTSTNLSSWRSITQVLFPNPAWTATMVPGVTDLWAPDVSFFGGLFHLYYAASTFNSKRSCIGHATRASISTGAWTDGGGPVICSNVDATVVNWNAIDPNVILDQVGVPWLVFGSGWDGIQIVRLTATGAVDATSSVTTIATRTAGVIEGAAMVRRCGYYYLFTSWDLCCLGAQSTYNIRVGRSTSMTGGFVDKSGVALTKGGGTLLLGAGNGWVGPGGESVLFDGARAYLVYHAYAATDGHFALHVSDLAWDASGWPVTSATP